MTVYLVDGRALVEQQEQWTADRRFIFLFPSSRASRSCRAPREISRSPRLAHKAPVMQARIRQEIKPTKQFLHLEYEHENKVRNSDDTDIRLLRARGNLIRDVPDVVTCLINAKVRNMPRDFQIVSESDKARN